jgi:hypothetical protein
MDKDTVTEERQVSEQVRKEQIDMLDADGEPDRGHRRRSRHRRRHQPQLVPASRVWRRPPRRRHAGFRPRRNSLPERTVAGHIS